MQFEKLIGAHIHDAVIIRNDNSSVINSAPRSTKVERLLARYVLIRFRPNVKIVVAYTLTD